MHKGWFPGTAFLLTLLHVAVSSIVLSLYATFLSQFSSIVLFAPVAVSLFRSTPDLELSSVDLHVPPYRPQPSRSAHSPLTIGTISSPENSHDVFRPSIRREGYHN